MWGVLRYELFRSEMRSAEHLRHAEFDGWHHQKVVAQKVYNAWVHAHPDECVVLVKKADLHKPAH